jgi:hypothetical protein
VAAVPLLPGLLDASRFEVLSHELVEHGVAAVHLAACGAGPATRRRLASELAREEDYRALFHAPPPDERELGRAALARGLALTVPRPLPTGPTRLRVRRFLAGQLLEAGDLWSRIEPSGREAATYFRAARFVDDSLHDFESLARDGNLRVLEWLEPGPRDLVAEALRDGRASLLEELRERCLTPPLP